MFGTAQTCQPMLLAAFLASSFLLYPTLAAKAQTTGVDRAAQTRQAVSSPTPATAQLPPAARTVRSERAAMMYRRLWGIEDITLRAAASGTVIRFSYRVVDAGKAKILNDKKQNPYLLVEKNGERLEVPTTEKVGQLRQTAASENGREYWMAFGNRNHTVQPGDRVEVVIGPFRASGLVVEPPHPVVVSKEP